MMWIALCAGTVTFVLLSRLVGQRRRVCADPAEAVLRVVGASGMFALAFAGGRQAAYVAALVAACCGVALTCNLSAAWHRVTARSARNHASTVTPFQKAT
jgi:hypothetical protein